MRGADNKSWDWREIDVHKFKEFLHVSSLYYLGPFCLQYLYNMSRDMWHFDKFSLGRACAAFF